VERTSDSWKLRIADYAEEVIRRLDPSLPGSEQERQFVDALIIGEYAMVRRRISGEPASRLMFEILTSAGRERVYKAAAEIFDAEPHFLAHYGKFLYDEDTRFEESRQYLFKAAELAPDDPLIHHMIGMSFRRELGAVLIDTDPRERSPELGERLLFLHSQAGRYFSEARRRNRNSPYGYVSHLECLIQLIRDRFRGQPPNAPIHTSLRDDLQLRKLFDEAYQLSSEAEQYVPGHSWLRELRAQLDAHHGDVSRAITAYQELLKRTDVADPSRVRRQLARALYERAVSKDAINYSDLSLAAGTIDMAIRDEPALEENIRIWFECVRLDPGFSKVRITEQLEHYFQISEGLVPAFYLMCLYFIRGIEERNPDAFRRFHIYHDKSVRYSQDLSYRSAIREWIGPGLVLWPRRFVSFDDNTRKFDVAALPRVDGFIKAIPSETAGYISVPPWNVEIFFVPRTKDRRFYLSDLDKPVRFAVAFAQAGPMAYDPEPVE
jgi:tetratricopeptide (TPR) repeat protein